MAKVFMICGKICSGKTTYALKLRETEKACLLSVDALMLNSAKAEQNMCHDEQVMKIKNVLLERAERLIKEGESVVLDWGFWSKEERKAVKEYFMERSIDYELHYINISDNLWDKRILKRNNSIIDEKTKAYFVDKGLKDKCIRTFEEPSENEVDLMIWEE